jgi:peptidyl-dipeptidase Dcp
VWPFLTLATRRDLREQVWRMWTNRGDNTGPQDNKPVAAEILQLRGELARLMGFQSYAHLALADRMAGTPETALALLERTWASVKPRALAQIADYQALADREGAGIRLAPWDRQFYAEKLRRERFGPRRRRRHGALVTGCRAAGPVLGPRAACTDWPSSLSLAHR